MQGAFRIDRLGELLRARNWGPGELAYQAKISYNYAWKISRGKAPNISGVQLAKVAAALDTSPDYLLGLTDDQQPPRGGLVVGEQRPEYHARRLPAEVQAVAAQLVDLGEDVRGKLLDAFDLILDVAGAVEEQAAQEGEAMSGAAEHLQRLFQRLSPDEVAYWTQAIEQRLAARQSSESQAKTTADLPGATAQTP